MKKCAGPEAFNKEVEKKMKKMQTEQEGGIHIDINSHKGEGDEELGKKKLDSEDKDEKKLAGDNSEKEYNAAMNVVMDAMGKAMQNVSSASTQVSRAIRFCSSIGEKQMSTELQQVKTTLDKLIKDLEY